MATEFEYKISDTYSGLLNHVEMHTEVRESSIGVDLNSVWFNRTQDRFGFRFADELTSEEEGLLDQLVAAHRGYGWGLQD